MAHKTSRFTIKEEELAKALEIPLNRLDEVIEFFDADPDDEWTLKEHDHFVYTNKTWENRIFSAHGAFAIAKYLDTRQPKSIWDKILEFVTHHRQKIRNAFVHKTVHENSSSLTRRNGHYFLSKKDTVAILGTSYARLNKAFEDIRRSDRPMEIAVDFDEFDGIRYYSLSGFYRLSQNLAQSLTSKDRQAWCRAVDMAGKDALKAITSAKERREKQIAKAMSDSRKRDKETCQITLVKKTKHNHLFHMASHHIFSSHHYPHLAAVVDNIITLTGDVHDEFHSWNGGSQNPCTVDDLIQFVCERYPNEPEVLTRLYEVKEIFPHEVPHTQARRPSDQRLLPEDKAA
ncbi:MAG: hypothetical protein HC800_16795 [Phormidesmis sp. RL_2_1]|nr:hypothetical protein [Phormidesmis sp. RL_2_1]